MEPWLKSKERENLKNGGQPGLFRKQFACQHVRAIDVDKRIIDFVISTESVDRYGDTISVAGWDLKAYRKNPVVLFGHDSRQPPIARALSVTKDTKNKQLTARAKFMGEDISPFADSIFKMYVNKFMKATSVGFIPMKWKWAEDDESRPYGIDFEKQELLEFSCVPVPANSECLVDAKSAGIDLAPLRAWAEQILDQFGGKEEEEINGLLFQRSVVEKMHKTLGPLQIDLSALDLPGLTDEQKALYRKNMELMKQAADKDASDDTDTEEADSAGDDTSAADDASDDGDAAQDEPDSADDGGSEQEDEPDDGSESEKDAPEEVTAADDDTVSAGDDNTADDVDSGDDSAEIIEFEDDDVEEPEKSADIAGILAFAGNMAEIRDLVEALPKDTKRFKNALAYLENELTDTLNLVKNFYSVEKDVAEKAEDTVSANEDLYEDVVDLFSEVKDQDQEVEEEADFDQDEITELVEKTFEEMFPVLLEKKLQQIVDQKRGKV